MIIKKKPPLTTRTQVKKTSASEHINKTKDRKNTASQTKFKTNHHPKDQLFESISPWTAEEKFNAKKTKDINDDRVTKIISIINNLSSKSKQFLHIGHKISRNNIIKQLQFQNQEENDSQRYIQSQRKDQDFIRHAEQQKSGSIFLKQKFSTQNSGMHLKTLGFDQQTRSIIPVSKKKLASHQKKSQSQNKYISQQLAERKMSMNKFRGTVQISHQLEKNISENKLPPKKKLYSSPSNFQKVILVPTNTSNTNNNNQLVDQHKQNKQRIRTMQQSQESAEDNNLLFFFKARQTNNVMSRQKNIMKIRNLMIGGKKHHSHWKKSKKIQS